MRGNGAHGNHHACGAKKVKRGSFGDLIVSEHWWDKA